jgi:hypothetical protein
VGGRRWEGKDKDREGTHYLLASTADHYGEYTEPQTRCLRHVLHRGWQCLKTGSASHRIHLATAGHSPIAVVRADPGARWKGAEAQKLHRFVWIIVQSSTQTGATLEFRRPSIEHPGPPARPR